MDPGAGDAQSRPGIAGALAGRTVAGVAPRALRPHGIGPGTVIRFGLPMQAESENDFLQRRFRAIFAPMDSKKLALACRALADNKKAENIVVLDVRKLSTVTDFFVIATHR